MRLCYIANPFSIHTRRWVRYFAEQGHEVSLIGVAPNVPRPLQPDEFPDTVRIINLVEQHNLRKIRYLVWGLMARRIVQQIQPDILHAHQIAGNGWVGAAVGYHPFVVTAWGSDLLLGVQRSWMQRQLARWVLHCADTVTCVSSQLAQAAQTLSAKGKHILVAQWGIDTHLYTPGPVDEALQQQLAPGVGPIILSIRALKPVYQPLTLADAIPCILKQHPDARFIIRTYAADTEILQEFKHRIAESGSGDNVTYVGELTDEQSIASLYRLADIAVSAPSSDGTPVSVLEAIACGAAPIVSDLPSLREWITDGENGLLVPVGDASALAEAIVRLLRAPQLREQFKQRNQDIIRARADHQVEMGKMERLYLELYEKPLP